MRYNSNAKKILFDPLKTGADHLYIVSGYAAPTMLSWYLTNLIKRTSRQIQISLVVGMVPYEGISTSVHNGFLDIIRGDLPWEVKKIECSYVYEMPAVHSNIYIWDTDGHPEIAYTGSAEFVQRSFVGSQCQDLMMRYNPNEAMDFYQSITDRCIYASHSEIEEYVTIRQTQAIFDHENVKNDVSAVNETIRLSLLTRNGYPGTCSGLNWGQRAGRNPNQAYIPLPQTIAKSGFFPLERRHFFVMTDDRKSLIMRVEQQNNKAITTPSNNSLLGEYFRNRLGLSYGARVTREDLFRYGRSDVLFTKLEEDLFYMDFSSPGNSV